MNKNQLNGFKAIIARINGEWDNPYLLICGYLNVNPDTDILKIAAQRQIPIFEQNEQLTYRNCPWGGRSELVISTDRFDIYKTTNVNHTGKDGYYLVDNDPS